MVDRNHVPLSSTQIETELFNCLERHRPILENWAAGLQSHLEHPSNRYLRRTRKGKLVSEQENVHYDYQIKFGKITLLQLRILIIISYFLDETSYTLIQLCAMERTEHDPDSHLALSIYLIDKVHVLLALAQNLETKDSFFGQVMNLISRIRKEVEDDKPSKVTIFRIPFWKQLSPFPKSKRYTGWRRHQNDHGSLRPSSYYRTNFLDDEEFMSHLRKELDQKKQSLYDSIYLTLGFIE